MRRLLVAVIAPILCLSCAAILGVSDYEEADCVRDCGRDTAPEVRPDTAADVPRDGG
jgi:hypothetical protein